MYFIWSLASDKITRVTERDIIIIIISSEKKTFVFKAHLKRHELLQLSLCYVLHVCTARSFDKTIEIVYFYFYETYKKKKTHFARIK